MKLPDSRGTTWWPQLNSKIWILAFGRLLSQLGTGLVLFYLQIFFVNQVGLSATAVGFAIGSASISGIVGRIAAGSMTDSTFWGRRRTLLLSVAISALGAAVIAITQTLPWLIAGNLIMGLGIGLYWPATEAVVADLSSPQHRHEAYAVTRFADNLGLGLGVLLGGVVIALTNAYRALMVSDACSFVILLGVIYVAIPETSQLNTRGRHGFKGWGLALNDQRLLTYVLVNIMLTTYLAQVNTVLPLYLRNFAQQGIGFPELTISALFGWHLALSVLCQLPIARYLNRYTHPQALMISTTLWGLGFGCVWATGVTIQLQQVPVSVPLLWAVLGLGVLGLATITYAPTASALVADLAPPSLRGIYLAINSLCWALGYFIGPSLGGWALDLSRSWVYGYWLLLILPITVIWVLLKRLDHQLR